MSEEAMQRKLSMSRELAMSAAPIAAPPITLTVGEPKFGSVDKNTYQWYTLTLDMATHPVIEIDVIPFSGDPDVYVTTDGSVPSVTHYDYYSISFDSEFIQIKPGATHYCDVSKATCTINIAIHGFTDATFMLWASTTNTTVELVAGLPYTNMVFPQKANDPSSGQFYKFWAGNSGEEILFQTTTYTPGVYDWELELFASTTNQFPNIRNNTWRSIGVTGYHYQNIVIEAGTGSVCYGCYYYLGVFGPLDHADGVVYSMLALNGPVLIYLVEGERLNAHAATGESRLYQADISSEMKSATISVKATYGDPDIFVTADGSIPGPNNFMWRSQSIGDDELVINSSDPLWQELCSSMGCDVHIAVRSFIASTYSIKYTVAH